MSNEMNTQEEKKVLTQKDLNKAMFRWYMSAEMPLNFENMQGIAFCGSISHILKKLYTKKGHVRRKKTNIGSAKAAIRKNRRITCSSS